MNAFSLRTIACVAILSTIGMPVIAAVSKADADKLKTSLTPLGGERAASADGQIPAWTGSLQPGFTFRSTPFDNEKPVATVSAANMQQYADKLTDGMKAILQKYPDYKIIVYPTHRTAVAPQWVYDNTYGNAVKSKLDGYLPSNIYGGVPFPIPANGTEVMWNHLLRWRAPSQQFHVQGFQNTVDGRHILTVDAIAEEQLPYYFQGAENHWNNEYWQIHLDELGPPIRSGEQLTGRENLNDDRTLSWIYLVGQRRTRELPNACCDTPNPATAGIMTFDEVETFTGRLDRYNWKTLGKQEMYIPYNSNITNAVSNDLLQPHFLNPNRVRWELHRVWVVEGTLRSGQRHEVPRVRVYLDEDSWLAVLADRWDAHKQLWKVGFTIPYVEAAVPAVTDQSFGEYDLQSGAWFASGLMNQGADYARAVTRFPDSDFSPQAMLRSAR